jgi:hypothetical protein
MHLPRRINWDGLGIFTSLLCAIHCAVLPLAVSFLPLLGLGFIRTPLFECGMIGLAFVIGTWALWHGFTHHHHRLTPWLLFVGGMILLIAKEIWGRYELYFLPFAVGLIISAHVVNYRLVRPVSGTRGMARAGAGDFPDLEKQAGGDLLPLQSKLGASPWHTP